MDLGISDRKTELQTQNQILITSSKMKNDVISQTLEKA